MKFRDKAHRYDFHRDTLCAFGGASLIVTQGVKDRFEDWQGGVLGAVVEYKKFTEDNDPYGEHDMGFFEVEDTKLMFKWDDWTDVPEDMKTPGVGPLMLTVMLAEEY